MRSKSKGKKGSGLRLCSKCEAMKEFFRPERQDFQVLYFEKMKNKMPKLSKMTILCNILPE